jgi:integrase
MVDRDPGEKIKRYRDTCGPDLDGVRRLLAHLERRCDPKAIRDRAIVRTLFDLALRRGSQVRGATWSTWTWSRARWPCWAGASASCLLCPHETAAALR